LLKFLIRYRRGGQQAEVGVDKDCQRREPVGPAPDNRGESGRSDHRNRAAPGSPPFRSDPHLGHGGCTGPYLEDELIGLAPRRNPLRRRGCAGFGFRYPVICLGHGIPTAMIFLSRAAVHFPRCFERSPAAGSRDPADGRPAGLLQKSRITYGLLPRIPAGGRPGSRMRQVRRRRRDREEPAGARHRRRQDHQNRDGARRRGQVRGDQRHGALLRRHGGVCLGDRGRGEGAGSVCTGETGVSLAGVRGRAWAMRSGTCAAIICSRSRGRWSRTGAWTGTGRGHIRRIFGVQEVRSPASVGAIRTGIPAAGAGRRSGRPPGHPRTLPSNPDDQSGFTMRMSAFTSAGL